MLLISIAATVHAESFFLVDRDSGKRYGPFEFKPGAVVAMDKKVFVIRKPDDEGDARGMAVEARMLAIKIPQLDLRQARIREAIDFIRQASIDFDDPKKSQNERGINLILNLQGLDESKVASITFSAHNIAVLEALNAITSSACLQYRIDGAIVFIEPKKTQIKGQ
jgi:hypothetical protein